MKNKIATTSFAAMAIIGVFAISHGAMAAELVKLEGKVSVNRGDGFELAKLGMVLKPGDQVLVGVKSAASLVYAQPGCVFEVAPASVVTVSEVGPCIPGETIVQGKGALVTPTQASNQDRNYCHDDDSATDDDNQCLPFFIMGGGAIIGATALMITTSGGGGDSLGGLRPPGSGGPGVSRP